MLRDSTGGKALGSPNKIFNGVRFVLFGFDSVSEAQYRSELVDGGGVDIGRYDSSCTHVIVSGRVFDEPICVAARNDNKILITELWVDDSSDLGMLADSTKVLYRPVRDLNGIPGSKSLNICLTGYQRQERNDIMKMVSLMGGIFSKPLIASQVTHLICYKFEGEKYELAKKVNIKLVNHRWLEDCLKAWEILPIDNYTKSGWEVEMLEAEAMDSDEEDEHAGKKVEELTGVAEPHNSRDELSIASGSSVEGSRKFCLHKDNLSAKSFELSANNHLISTPQERNSFGKTSDFCDTMGKVLKALDLPEGKGTEQFLNNHGIGTSKSKQPSTPDSTDLSMKGNTLAFNVNNSLMANSSCEKHMKLSPLRYSKKVSDKINSPEEQISNFCTPHKEKTEEVNLTRDANNSLINLNNSANKMNNSSSTTMIGVSLPHVEGKDVTLPQKRKLSVSRPGSKSIKSDRTLKNSGLVSVPTSINSDELDSLKPQQCKPEEILTNDETIASISCMEKGNDSISQKQKLSASNSYLRPNSIQDDSRTYTKQCLSISTIPGQSESMGASQCDSDTGLSHLYEIEGTDSVKPRGNQHGPLSKSSSLRYNRKSVKQGYCSSVVNISDTSISNSDNKDVLQSVPSKRTLDGPVCSRYGAVSRTENFCNVTSPEALVLSDCPRNSVTGLDENGNLGNNGGNANEAFIGMSVLETSSKSMKKSEIPLKSHKFDGASMKYRFDFHDQEPEQHEKRPGKDEDVIPSSLKNAKMKSSNSAEIPGDCKQSTDIENSINCNSKVLVSRNRSCIPKARRKNGCKDKRYSKSLGVNLNNTAIALGHKIVEGNADSLREKVGNVNSQVIERTEVVQDDPTENVSKIIQHDPPESKFNVIQDNNRLDPEENKLKHSGNFSMKDDNDSRPKVVKKSMSFLTATSSGRDIVSQPKQSCPSAAFSEPACFILSGNQDQQKKFQKIIRHLRGRILKRSHNWSYKATHFIVPDSVKRTEKFFAAAAAGRWILRPDYLTASREAGKFLDELPFEWHRSGLSEDGAISLEAPRKWRTLKQTAGCGAFYGMQIIIYGECIAPSLDTLKRVVKAGDGTILATAPPYTRFLKSGVDFAVVSASIPHIDLWVQEFLKHEIPCILADYLVEYVCKPGYPLDKHILYKTHPWVEKSLANLQSRISKEMKSDNVSTEDGSDEIVCSICGSGERGEVMLICGNEAGTLGCGVGSHIDCCDPPLSAVPETDWFCSRCSGSRKPKKSTKKGNVKSRKGN